MRRRDFICSAAALALLPVAAAKPAPVPKGVKPPVVCADSRREEEPA